MSVTKLDKPLIVGGKQVYPLSTTDQILKLDGTKLETENGINADTLGGQLPEYYAVADTQGINPYAHSTGTLTGTGENGKFKATVSETVSSINVNGTACFVNCGGENSIELVKDCWYTFILDGTSINFKSGGSGLSNSKLALATATEADVLSSKTFYSGDKELKTGTLTIKTHTIKTHNAGTLTAGHSYGSGSSNPATLNISSTLSSLGLSVSDSSKYVVRFKETSLWSDYLSAITTLNISSMFSYSYSTGIATLNVPSHSAFYIKLTGYVEIIYLA